MAATKTLGDVNTITTPTGSQYVILTDDDGNLTKITLAKLLTYINTAASAASESEEP